MNLNNDGKFNSKNSKELLEERFSNIEINCINHDLCTNCGKLVNNLENHSFYFLNYFIYDKSSKQ